MKKAIIFPLLFISSICQAQSVGIGTNTPNGSSILDLGPSAKPFVLPRLTLTQMNEVASPALGMVVYNTDEQQLYSYMQYQVLPVNPPPGQSNNRWQPVSTGPRMLAWGVVDSFGTQINGSFTFTVTWDPTTNWYRMGLSNPHQYYKDSMLLMVTPVGSGSWDQMPSTTELIEPGGRIAIIKFTDASRLASGSSSLDSRRRSGFHFTLYDLRRNPY